MRLCSALAVIASLAPGAARAQTPLPRTHPPQPTVPAITAGDLETRLYIFADDSMQGREAGTIGNVRATDYIARELTRLGVEPAGENGTYFQTIPLKTRSLDSASTLTVSGTALTPFTDFLPLDPRPVSSASLVVVYGGVAGDTAHPLAPGSATGKLVVFVTPGVRGLRPLRTLPQPPGAAAIAFLALDSMPALFLTFLRGPRGFLDDTGAGPSSPPLLLISRAAAARMFSTPLAYLVPGAPGATTTLDLRFKTAASPEPARNVIGIVRGSDSTVRGEYVALGAHSDHLGFTDRPVDHDSMRIWNHLVRPDGADDFLKQASPAEQATVDSMLNAFRARHPGTDRLDSIYNGADDDGSGSVTLLEIAEELASRKVKPHRSILLVWHTAEEKGLLGSRYFTDHPTVPRDSIVAQLNMDMVGRGDVGDQTGRAKDGRQLYGEARYLQLVGTRRLSTELGVLIERINRVDHHDMTFDYALDANGHPSNIYCRSDHYEYARFGIPIAFFTTGLHSDYHQVTDEAEYIDYTHMTLVAQFVEDVAVHVADLDHRLLVDHPKPNPNGVCQQ